MRAQHRFEWALELARRYVERGVHETVAADRAAERAGVLDRYGDVLEDIRGESP